MFGFILPLLSAIGAIGGAASAFAGARQNTRDSQTRTVASHNRDDIERYGLQQGFALRAGENEQGAASQAAQQQQSTDFRLADLDLMRRQFGLTAPGQRMRTGIAGDIFANITDAPMSHPRANVVNFRTLASALGPTSRQLGALTAQQMLEAQMAGDEFAPVPVTPLPVRDFDQDLLTPPTPTAYPQPGKLDSILNVLGAIGGTAGVGESVAKQLSQRRLRPIPQTPWYAPPDQRPM